MDLSVTLAREFERESHRIDQMIWDAMGLRAGESVLFCGFANSLAWIKRAAGIGVRVSVISDDSAAIAEFRDLPVNVLRGSTSMLPARDESFDATIAFHYLHEVDPLFHANIVSELARVGKRSVIVEPAPPSDPLGLRIASLYSRAKRQLGQFENYHQVDYWRKLLAIVKRDVSYQTFSFTRTPPPQAVRDTVALIIDTMAAEETPESYLAELRTLAARSDAQLVPQARYVIIGASQAATVSPEAGTDFRERPAEEPLAQKITRPFVPSVRGSDAVAPSVGQPKSIVYTSPNVEPEFPAVLPPGGTLRTAAASPEAATDKNNAIPASDAAVQVARNAFGLAPLAEPRTAEAADSAAFGASDESVDAFGVAEHPFPETPAEFGWAWEPPENAAKP